MAFKNRMRSRLHSDEVGLLLLDKQISVNVNKGVYIGQTSMSLHLAKHLISNASLIAKPNQDVEDGVKL